VRLEIRGPQNPASVAAPEDGRAPGAARYDFYRFGRGFGNSVGRKICERCCARGRALSGGQQDTILPLADGLEIRWAAKFASICCARGRARSGAARSILPLAVGFGNSVGRKICERCCARGRRSPVGSRYDFTMAGLEIPVGGKSASVAAPRRARPVVQYQYALQPDAHHHARIYNFYISFASTLTTAFPLVQNSHENATLSFWRLHSVSPQTVVAAESNADSTQSEIPRDTPIALAVERVRQLQSESKCPGIFQRIEPLSLNPLCSKRKTRDDAIRQAFHFAASNWRITRPRASRVGDNAKRPRRVNQAHILALPVIGIQN